MNWIDYSKRKPEPEPKRQLWVKIREKDNHVYYSVAWSTASFDVDYITDWAEIEPPSPPTPDPFEELFQNCHSEEKHLLRQGWDAAIRWKEKQ